MTDDDRRHFNNLVLLCDECHSMIDSRDNASKYPVETLRQWKTDHEAAASGTILVQNPTLIGIVIDAIASADLDVDLTLPPEGTQPFGINNKIDYNGIRRNRALLDEYKIYYPKIASLYDALENAGSFKKESLLRNVRRLYLVVKGRYVKDSDTAMRIVREHADDMIDDVAEELLRLVEGSGKYTEDAAFGVSLVMVDAFMRCKILEAPPT